MFGASITPFPSPDTLALFLRFTHFDDCHRLLPHVLSQIIAQGKARAATASVLDAAAALVARTPRWRKLNHRKSCTRHLTLPNPIFWPATLAFPLDNQISIKSNHDRIDG